MQPVPVGHGTQPVAALFFPDGLQRLTEIQVQAPQLRLKRHGGAVGRREDEPCLPLVGLDVRAARGIINAHKVRLRNSLRDQRRNVLPEQPEALFGLSSDDRHGGRAIDREETVGF